MLFTLSRHLVLGLPRLLFPLISTGITSFSIRRSSLIPCPRYIYINACATLDSSVHSGLMFPAPTHYLFSPSTTLSSLAANTTSQMHQLSSSLLFSSSRSSLRRVLLGTQRPSPARFTFVPSMIPLYFHNMKLVTTSAIFPSTVTSPISSVAMPFVFRTFR